jgi:hypothetical protein
MDSWETGLVCRACRAPVRCQDGQHLNEPRDYLYWCTSEGCAHRSGEGRYDMEDAPDWCALPGDTRSEEDVRAEAWAEEDYVANLRAAQEAGDWEKFRELLVKELERKKGE